MTRDEEALDDAAALLRRVEEVSSAVHMMLAAREQEGDDEVLTAMELVKRELGAITVDYLEWQDRRPAASHEAEPATPHLAITGDA